LIRRLALKWTLERRWKFPWGRQRGIGYRGGDRKRIWHANVQRERETNKKLNYIPVRVQICNFIDFLKKTNKIFSGPSPSVLQEGKLIPSSSSS
jgi:hypothetical protein